MLLTLALAAAALAAPGSNTDPFLGTFNLTETRAGSCESSMEVSLFDADYDFGSGFQFLAVNLGPQHNDDDLVTIDSTATAHGGHMTLDRTMLTKASGERSVTHREARISGDTLTLADHVVESSPTEPSFSFDTKCVYLRVPAQQ